MCVNCLLKEGRDVVLVKMLGVFLSQEYWLIPNIIINALYTDTYKISRL